ncbi:MAG: MAPEG family protein [Noviherbaspirillum sp.]
MAWLHLVAVLALFQFLLFGALVARARGKYGVHAPATTGNEVFERFYRVQINTLELLVLLLPAMWIAAAYWDPRWVAAAGAVYLAGRMVYLRAYTTEPRSRGLGYMLSIAPVVTLMTAALAGVALAVM